MALQTYTQTKQDCTAVYCVEIESGKYRSFKSDSRIVETRHTALCDTHTPSITLLCFVVRRIDFFGYRVFAGRSLPRPSCLSLEPPTQHSPPFPTIIEAIDPSNRIHHKRRLRLVWPLFRFASLALSFSVSLFLSLWHAHAHFHSARCYVLTLS